MTLLLGQYLHKLRSLSLSLAVAAVGLDASAALVTSATGPLDGTYTVGQALDFTLTFDERVDVTGVPRLALMVGATPRYAEYLSGTGTTVLRFRYIVHPGDADGDGVTVFSPLLTATGTLTATSDGSTASRSFPSPQTDGVLVDPKVPIDIALSSWSVPEHQTIGTSIATLSTVHGDSTAICTYSLVPGEDDADNTAFTIDGTTLRTAIDFDYRLQKSHRLRIRATDHKGRSIEKPVVLTVDNWATNFHFRGASGVLAIAQDATALYCGGYFDYFGSVPANRIIRIDKKTGTVTRLGSGMDGNVNALALDANGNLYAGGAFSRAGDVAGTSRIAKWDGFTWSPLGSGVDNSVAALAIDDVGNLYAGGAFTTAGRLVVNNIARWDGTAWSAMGSGLDASVDALVADRSGNLYVGGNFTHAGNLEARRVAKWSRSTSTWSNYGGFENTVQALALDGSDHLWMGGGFTERVYPGDNSLWQAFYFARNSIGDVHALAIAPNGTVYAGGTFIKTDGRADIRHIAYWNTSRQKWMELGGGVLSQGPYWGSVEAISIYGNDVYIGGSIGVAGTTQASGIVKWNGETWQPLCKGDGLYEFGTNCVLDAGSMVYVGGYFTFAGGQRTDHIAAWNKATHTWSPLGSGLNGTVNAIAMIGTDLYVGGEFTKTGAGLPCAHIARWDSLRLEWSAVGDGFNLPIRALAVRGATLYAGGDFTSTAGTVPMDLAHLSQWNGFAWSPLGTGLDGTVRALVATKDRLYAGGDFTALPGDATSRLEHIAQWNGTAWSSVGSGFDRPVFALARQGTTLYAGGDFGDPYNGVAQWDEASSSWSALGNGIGKKVRALAVRGSSLFAGGYFDGILARWDSAKAAWSPIGSGIRTGSVSGLAASDTALYVSCSLIVSNGTQSIGFAVYREAAPASIVSVDAPSPGSYGALRTLDFTVNFTGPVAVTGSPRLPLTVGGSTRYALYLAGSGSSILTFRYLIEVGDVDADGLSCAGSLDLNGGTIIDTTQGGTADLVLHRVGPLTSLRVGLAAAARPVPTPAGAPFVGGSLILAPGGQVASGLTCRWQRNGHPLDGTETGLALPLIDLQPHHAGLYTYTLENSDGMQATSEPLVVGPTVGDDFAGTAKLTGADLRHPNGHTYDQFLLTGPGATLGADPAQTTRISFRDLSEDIIQVEFSGAGSLSVVMDGASSIGPAPNYNQPDVAYTKGHASLIITGADETTNIAVFSVGRKTAVNQALFRDEVVYDGVANIAFIAIQSSNGKFGGVRTANVTYFAAAGYTGIYAPGVAFTGPLYVGDIQAFDAARPVLVVGSVSDARITGGSLAQPNHRRIWVSGLDKLDFSEGQTSNGTLTPAETNQGVFEQDGIDVTDRIVSRR